MKATLHFRKCLVKKVISKVRQSLPIILSATQKKMILIGVLLTNVLISSFAQKTTGLLSTYDSCHLQPPQQTPFAIEALSVGAPMVRVAYVIPSNRTPQPNGVANLQYAIKSGRQFFKEQMEQNGFGPKTFIFETEDDGVTPLIHVVHVAETDEYLRGDLWGRAQTAASNGGISLWAPGEVWVVIPETHVMFPDGSGAGGVALGAGFGSGNSGGVSMIGSNALPLFHPAMITDDTPYDGKVLPELGPYPMKQDVTFAWFEGTTFSSIASSWLGALWHETGHAFGLSHDFRNDNNFHGNLMGNGLRGTRGSLFPEKYPQDYTRLEYASSLLLNVSHFFNSDIKIANYGPNLTHTNPVSVIPQRGLVHISFQAWDSDSLSFAWLRHGGDMVAEIMLEGMEADTVFAVPYFTQGDLNQYTIVVYDKQGNITYSGVQFNVPGGNNQSPIPFVRIEPPVPGLNQPIVLNATQSFDVDHDQSSLLAAWDVDNDGQFDTEPSTNKTVQHRYEYGGNYLIRVKLTDAAGAQTISTPVSVKIPGEKRIAVESFTLINADNDEAVGNLQNNMVIKLVAWDGKTFSVRANTSSSATDRVEFDLKGPITHKQTDGVAPYALFGDNPAGDYSGKKLLPGEYTLTATPFSLSGKGIALTASFRVIDTSVPGQPTIVRDKTIGGSEEDQLRRVISTSVGGYLLAGLSRSNASGDKSENSNGYYDCWVVKLDAQHNKQWDKTIGGDNYEEFNSTVPAPDGGFLLAGYSNSNASGDKTENSKGSADYWVVKIDNQGNKVWDKTFGGSGQDLLYSVLSIPDGGYLLAGHSDSNVSGDKSESSKGSDDYWVIKIDEQGNKIWDKTFGGSSYDALRSAVLTADGYLLGGRSSSDISGDKSENNRGIMDDYWVVKIDTQGNKVWDKTIGGSNSDILTFAILSPDEGYLLGGYSISNASRDKSENSKGGADGWVVKIDAAGNKVWDKTYGGDSGDEITSAVSTLDGGYLLGGSSSTNTSGDKSENSKGSDDYWAVKIDPQGNKVWDKTIGGSSFDFAASTILTRDGTYLLAGYSRSDASGDKSENSRGSSDYWIVELKEPTTQVVTSLTLMNAQTDQEIKELKDGDVINLAAVGTRLLDIRANITAENINKVTFDLKGPVSHRQTEMNPPYALFSNHEGDFKGKELLPGAYTMIVTPYINDTKGAAALTISFTVTEDPVVTSLTLMNAHTDQEITELIDGDVVSLTAVGTNLLDIRANIIAENVSKVAFDLKGPVSQRQTELNPPYALFSNHESDFKGRKLLPGAYTLTVTPYINDTKTPALTITFTVIEGSVVTSLTLMNAHTDQEIKELNDGDVISLAAVGTKLLDIRANITAENVSKVAFDLKGPVSHRQTELNPPYALFSNHEDDFKGRELLPGEYSLTVTPYTNNKEGAALTISFGVISALEAGLQVEVYPVPASGVINLTHEGNTEQAHIILLDFNGNVLLQQPLSSQPVERLDVSAFGKGIHYLKVVSPEGLQIIRLVLE